MKKEDLKSPNPEWSYFKDDLAYLGEKLNPSYEEMRALIECTSFDQLTGFWAGLAEALYTKKYS